MVIRLLRIVKRQFRQVVYTLPSRRRRGNTLRQRLFQPFDKCIFKRRKDLIHLATAGHHAARRQHDAVIKSLTLYIPEDALKLAIALLFIEFVLVVVKKMRNVVLLTHLLYRAELSGKIADLFVNQRNAFFRQRTLQGIQMRTEISGLSGGHIMLLPLSGSSDKQRQHAGVFRATGCRQGDVVMQAQIRAKPNQMGGHKTPGNCPLCP